MTRILCIGILLMGSMALASGEWVPSKTPEKALKNICSPSTFGVEANKFHVMAWHNGKSTFTLCTYDKSPTSSKFTLEQSYEAIFISDNKQTTVADEAEAETKARTFDINGGNILITIHLNGLGSSAPVLTQKIICKDGTCTLSQKECAVIDPQDGKALATKVNNEIKKSKHPLKVWEKYFMGEDEEGSKIGDKVQLRALLGDANAKAAVIADVGADGGDSEVQVGYVEDIGEIVPICAGKTKK